MVIASTNDTVTCKMYQASGPSYHNYWDLSDIIKIACEATDLAPKSTDITAGSDLTIYWEGDTSELLNQASNGDTDCMSPWFTCATSVDLGHWSVLGIIAMVSSDFQPEETTKAELQFEHP
ncbi:hypothetical protein K435DRAFT_880028 [Dendrothele bispora CBS 962.96]|uniref:Uncharacterized protein n=1 Tax=Dendrothele bispora (strain CBS 962.96) TaxID=1314807 RepID=A0A4S8KKB3_DENBC|nr:hypothetical protein K435DRAFT_880028 [Dendrothele bispora CBS 962.96]